MLIRFGNFFRKSKPSGGRALLLQLGDANIFLISATISDGIDAKMMTKEQLLAEIQQALERDRECQETGYALFTYIAERKRRLPFFTSNDHAQTFCGEYSKLRNRVFPFMVLQAKGTVLGKITPSSCDVVIMNDLCADARILTDGEISTARRMWG